MHPLFSIAVARACVSEAASLGDKAVRNALAATLLGRYTREERSFFATIERRRGALSSSSKVIEMVDYGAGSPSSTATRAEQDTGVRKSVSVSRATRASQEARYGRLLFNIVKFRRPKTVLEMGTCVGISGAYIAAGLDAAQSGRLCTIEGDPALAEIARETFAELDLDAQSIVGPFHEVLESTVEEIQPIDLAFVDGHHDGLATEEYFEQLRPALSRNAILVFDDVNWSEGMLRGWQRIRARPEYHSFEIRNLGFLVAKPGDNVT